MIQSLIFFPEKNYFETPDDYGFVFEDIFLSTQDGARIHGWFLKTAALEKGLILFFHGNAGNISHRLFKVGPWLEAGWNIFLLDYRGYGQSQGAIKHENDLVSDAEAAWTWAEEKYKNIVLMGESLGTYPAIRLAGQHQAEALILEAPFTSFVDLGKMHYSAVPGIEMMMKDFRFANIEMIGKVKTRALIIHGTHDEICPYKMALELMKYAPEPKELLTIQGGTHNDLPMSGAESYHKKILEWCG